MNRSRHNFRKLYGIVTTAQEFEREMNEFLDGYNDDYYADSRRELDIAYRDSYEDYSNTLVY